MAVQIVVVKDGVVIGSHDPAEPLSWVAQYVSDTTINYFASNEYLAHFELEDVTETEIIVYEDQTIAEQVVSKQLVGQDEIPDPRIAMSTANAKLAAISNITLYHNYRILNTYPTQKQIDINALAYNPATGSAWASQDKTDMQTFINTELTAIRTKTTAINALADTAAVLAYANYYA